MPTAPGALLALAALALARPVLAEPSPATSAPPPAPAPEPAAPAAPGSPPARPPAEPDAPPVATLVRAAVAVEPGARLPLSPSAEVVVDPASSFEIELAARMTDARLVLVDAQGDHVPASELHEIGETTRLTLKPAAPLSPGSRYAVRLDGATRREPRDAAGRAFSPLTLPVLAAGTPPPPPEPARPARRRAKGGRR